MTTSRASRIRRTLSPAAQQHVAEAMRLLYSDAPGLAGDDALAERERLRTQDEAHSNPQATLLLESRP
ncbi:hypothetical protein [Xanthomonas vasicola]|uniref:hypothetical protein n=1 Tax=Xanthomonas vasicola TaxID=56459 RepID=UPI000531CE86|nr:hypothetical protein [Xanthomonas vasicola]AZR24393.1 hypothetical protein NX81_021395 [Xanthomonas vasicola]MBV7304172.1 hypothetical protein [Xanthomonas vasicola pv. vasculorum]MDO6934565.1 hypothetical protein [Xanthomonas vasicola]MDO6938228.1 hypothetical protein [Xanthomonas vasicola]